MARRAPALFVVRVWIGSEDSLPLVANFTNRTEAMSYEWKARDLDGVVHTELSPGYMIHKTSDEALDNLKMWMR